MFLGGFVIPVLTIAFLYLRIWLILDKKTDIDIVEQTFVKRVSSNRLEVNHPHVELQIPIYRNSLCKESMYMNKRPSQSSFQNATRETKVLKITIIAISMFCFAWAPYALLSMYCQYGRSPEKYVNRMTSLIAAIFAKSAAIYNPIIYIYLNSDCQIYIRSMFNRMRRIE